MLEAMDNFANPSSLHKAGQDAQKIITGARKAVANALGLRSLSLGQLVFTSGGTEANNTAIFGTVYAKKRRVSNRVITTDSEHPSVENTLAKLEADGFEIVRIPTLGGELDFEAYAEALKKPPLLVTMMMVNNETGAVYDVARAFDMAKKNCRDTVTHCDAVQGFLKCRFTPAAIHADLISISSHKAVYSNGTVLDKQTGEESVLTPKETLRRILYDDGIDLSAWAKLYKAELFETIRFPFGRVFEDAATTYLLVDKAQKIAVCSVATYNYMIRDNSITGTSFSPKKMHLITSTQEMCDYVRAKYPDLEKPCDRRLMYAYLSTLSQLAMSKQKFPEEQKILMDYVTKNGNAILKDEKAEKRDKLGIVAAKFGFTSFKLLWNFYRKISGRK
jgi:hypothetical protein